VGFDFGPVCTGWPLKGDAKFCDGGLLVALRISCRFSDGVLDVVKAGGDSFAAQLGNGVDYGLAALVVGIHGVWVC
jgi:hypothetical protein